MPLKRRLDGKREGGCVIAHDHQSNSAIRYWPRVRMPLKRRLDGKREGGCVIAHDHQSFKLSDC